MHTFSAVFKYKLLANRPLERTIVAAMFVFLTGKGLKNALEFYE